MADYIAKLIASRLCPRVMLAIRKIRKGGREWLSYWTNQDWAEIVTGWLI